MTPRKLEILVISDLHAHGGDPSAGKSPSYFSTNSLYSGPEINPLANIAVLLKTAGLKADWIVSPGDLGDKADPSAQKEAWNELEKIRTGLDAKHLIATVGNHDVDSRRTFSSFDPKSALQRLDPPFPLDLKCYSKDDGVYVDRFWSRNFVVVPFHDYDCTLLIINSCAFHGYSSDISKPPNEHLRGRISPLTRQAIEHAIGSCQTRVNIALVHHHLVKHPFIDDGNSLMIDADKLIESFKKTDKQWLIIHGHQHTPFISYADATAFAPIILSAGSVAAKTHRMPGGHARNQIHHISIDTPKLDADGFEVFGELTTWSWAFEHGWQKATTDGGISYQCGFGYRFGQKDTRDLIVAAAKNASPGLLTWQAVLKLEPRLRFTIPSDVETLLTMVKSKGVAVDYDQFGFPNKLEWQS